MSLIIDKHLSIGAFEPEDVAAFAEYANDIDVYINSLRIPHPYTKADAEIWVFTNIDRQRRKEPAENFTIRYDGVLIGGIGYMACGAFQEHSVEIGYWLAKPYRGQGMMGKVIRAFCKYLFADHPYTKIIAFVFAENKISQLLLEKNGFEREGYLKNHYQKGDKLIDAVVFGQIKPL